MPALRKVPALLHLHAHGITNWKILKSTTKTSWKRILKAVPMAGGLEGGRLPPGLWAPGHVDGLDRVWHQACRERPDYEVAMGRIAEDADEADQ